MNKDINYILKRVLIGVLIFIIITFIKSCNVKAEVVIFNDPVVLSGSSLKDIAKVGSNYIGKGYYQESTDNTYIEKYLTLDFLTGGLPDLNHQGGSNYTTHYTLDVCVNGALPNFAIWSSYNNFIDYVYYTNTQVYALNEDWARLQCYRYFIRLNTNYIWVGDPYGSGFDYVELFANANTIKFGVSSNYGYGLMVRYNDLVYYSPSDYNRLLNEAKQIHTQEDIANGINNINNTMNDDSTPNNGDFNDAINSVTGALPTNSTIASLVTMPITFLQKIIDGLGGTCTPIVIGELFDFTMTMPCINPADYIGIIWNIIDVICAGFFAFVFGKKLVVIFHNITSMREGGLKEAYD